MQCKKDANGSFKVTAYVEPAAHRRGTRSARSAQTGRRRPPAKDERHSPGLADCIADAVERLL